MPESNDSPVTRRSIPAVHQSGNRLVAALIDMMVVALPTLLVALVLSERFSILDDTAGRPRFSDAEQLRINEIDRGFNRALRLGDTVFTLSGMGWWLTVLVLVALTAFIFVVVPSKLRKRTPGQLVLAAVAGTGLDSDGGSSDESTTDGIEIETVILTTEPLVLLPQDAVEATAESEVLSEVEALSESSKAVEPQESVERSKTAEPQEIGQPQETVEPQEIGEPQETVEPDQVTVMPISLGAPADYQNWDDQHLSITASADAPVEPRSYDKLNLSESSLAESPLNASTAVKTAVATPTADSPIWSDMWKAWLFWDPASDRWFRHDTDDNSWKPLK